MEQARTERDDAARQVAEPAPGVPAPLAAAAHVGEPAPLGTGSVLALQRTAGNAAVSALMPQGEPGDVIARTAAGVPADSQVERALAASARDRRAAGSPALRLRSLLRSRAAIMRAPIPTSGGEWDTDKYDLLKDVDQSGSATPAAWGMRGLDITLRFTPKDPVDAESIGLTQSVQAFVNNAPNLTPAASTRAIPAKDAEAINTGPGETDEGTAIDRAAGFNNPIYPVKSPDSKSLDDPNTAAGWGQLGYHYKDAVGAPKHLDATLIDKPMRSGAQKDSRHIFETTALATKGAQAGTYYGSVRWGWRTDAAGAFTKIDLVKVSDGVPSSTFLKAASIWNPGKSSTGKDNLDLPIPDVKVTTGPVTLLPPIPRLDIPLPVGTRLQIVTDLVGPMTTGTVKVVDGPNTGETGEVSAAQWGNIADERA